MAGRVPTVGRGATDASVARRPHRWTGAAALAAVAGFLLAGCSGAPETETPDLPARTVTPDAGTATTSAPTGGTAVPETAPGPAAPDAPEGLEEFYAQPVEWVECEDFECGQVTVPVDYADPEGETIAIEVLRVPASGDRLGSLFVNPGGPGVSGVEYAQSAPLVVSEDVRERYDIVGFDPRGVGGSAPVRCIDDPALDEMLGSDPTPDTEQEEAAIDRMMQEFAAACEENVGDLLGHLSTVEAARDLDILRAAVGEDRLDYLGSSYGTYLGATYATLFPDTVGRFVLDGAVDPGLTGLEMGLGQAEGFERATVAYVEDCVESGGCPLGDDVETARQGLRDVLTRLDSDPLPVDGDSVGRLTEGWGMWGVIVAMYDQAGWPVLTRALEQAMDGDGSLLMFLANIYADRNPDGSYSSNTMQAIYAVNCLDRPGDDDVDDEEVLERFQEVSPTWGAYLAGASPCEYWPVEAQETVEDYAAEGAAPIVVIGTTRDPATPYEWAQGLAETLESGVLISYDGDGHTAYGRSNDCVTDAVDAYLVDGTVPEDGLSC